jgi:hypothetical protein
MIVVRVELWSAVNGSRRELARMRIANDGETTLRDLKLGTYRGETLRGRSSAALDAGAVQRKGKVQDWPREALHVWNLVAAMLSAMGYGRKTAPREDLERVDDPVAHVICGQVQAVIDEALGEDVTPEAVAVATAAATAAIVQTMWRFAPPDLDAEAVPYLLAAAAKTYVDQLVRQDQATGTA